jgi:hypothetical protein
MSEINEIVEMARFVARVLGKPQTSSLHYENGEVVCATQVVCSDHKMVYADKYMVIFASTTNWSLELIIRSGVTSSGYSNPAIMVDANGEVYRMHGETHYIEDYLRSLVAKIANVKPANKKNKKKVVDAK